MKISFCNDGPFPCGCKCRTSYGGGHYSSSVTIVFCERHAPKVDPEKEARERGYVPTGAGWAPKYKEDGSNTMKCLHCDWTGLEVETFKAAENLGGVRHCCPSCGSYFGKLYYCYEEVLDNN